MKSAKKTILVIEDSLVQRLALLKLLKQWDINILAAENGKEGVDMAHQVLPDVILLDVQMPGLSGFDVCRLLRDDTRTAKIPIILFTSHNDVSTMKEGYLSGAIEFIPKDGFHEAVLLETLFQLGIFTRTMSSHA